MSQLEELDWMREVADRSLAAGGRRGMKYLSEYRDPARGARR